MTDDLERLEALAKSALELAADFRTGSAQIAKQNYLAALRPEAILSLIQRVREAETERTTEVMGALSDWRLRASKIESDIAAAHAAGRAEALEEAAKVAEDLRIDPLGPYEVQERITAAIRALGEMAHA